jgi:putative nucleotidyltransferase-like protein
MMRQGMAPLLGLLQGHAGNGAIADSEWSALLQVAAEENVLPLLAERMRVLEVELTPPQRDQILEVRRKAALSAFVWAETLKNTLGAFHRAKLPVISLKGPCLAARLYGDVSFRAYGDLDLLVQQSDLSRAEELLAELGFVPCSRADDYHRPWRRKAINLELHHNFDSPLAFDFQVNATWYRAQLSQFSGVPVWLLAPCDELFYLCIHAVRHRFDRLCLLVDLGFAIRGLPLQSDILLASRSFALDNVFALAWMMATRLDPEIPLLPEIHARPRDRARLEQFAERLWQERMAEPASPLDWVAQHRFYLEMETPGWPRIVRRWRHLRILLTRLIEPDFAFAEQFNLHRAWQARLLRPIRLLIKAVHPTSRMLELNRR